MKQKTAFYHKGQLRFAMGSQLRSALAINDDLGFDNAWLAADAILRHSDWQERWEVESQHIEFFTKWRNETLKANNIIE